MEDQVKAHLREFINANYLFGDETRAPRDNDSLLEAGVLDSTGVLELIEHLEQEYGIEVSDTETVPDNLGSISGLTRFVLGKLSSSSAGALAPALAVDGDAVGSGSLLLASREGRPSPGRTLQ